MAREHRDICHLREGEITPKEKSFLDLSIEKITTKNSKDLIYGEPKSQVPMVPSEAERPTAATEAIPPPKPVETFKPSDEPQTNTSIFEKPAFLPPKAISHSPKISPSSIPNPSPSIAASKQIESGYPNYAGYLYNIPGYSAFQPVSYPGMLPPQPPVSQAETPSTDFVPFPSVSKDNSEEKANKAKTIETQASKGETQKAQTDFEDQFTPEIIPASVSENKSLSESKMSITSLAQGSGATVTIPAQISKDCNKKKQPERFSLKTSIPISKIDMKCVNPPDSILTTSASKKSVTFNPAFQSSKPDNVSKVEIQSNIIIKSALKEPEADKPMTTTANNINTLINAAEAVNKSDAQFRKPEPKVEVINEIKDPPPVFSTSTTTTTRPVFNPANMETSKAQYLPKPSDSNLNDQKNQILFIQNKNQNPKMLLTIQQPNPQVLLQRTNFESKNAQVPSRLSSQSKKSKDDIIDNGASSKVVALKRLHQENCDENDFENLITENQIYGNKIVVKEKSQGTLQEQDLKHKKVDKSTQDGKNVVLQPNFLYLSNVQFPGNLMMIKNGTKINQSIEANKGNKITSNENKITNEASTMTNSNEISNTKNIKPQNVNSKEIHVLKSSNNVLQTLSNKNSKPDLVFQTPHQKVLMNSQILYQVPMIVDADNKLNQPFMNRDYPKFIGQNKKEYPKQFDQKTNDKLYIACPYQMDSKLQPKIVITNIRPKITKIDEISSLDIYEKRKRLRRLKYLSNRETKESQKIDARKVPDKVDVTRNIITPDKMKEEICKEFSHTKVHIDEGSSESESDYDEEELKEYESIIKCYSETKENNSGQAEFLAHFNLGTREVYKDKEMDRRERVLSKDSVASAYIAAGRLDRLTNEDTEATPILRTEKKPAKLNTTEDDSTALQLKQTFLSQLKLMQVSPQYKEGYEKAWEEILKERDRRDGVSESKPNIKPKAEARNIELDPNGQLQILTEIKKSVNENNNLIKKKIDSLDNETNVEGDSIHTLAEKNFSELNRLSKMADRSVKLITGQDTRKRDLNPGFDSENIPKPIKQPINYPHINIPNISKIISLKSQDTSSSQTTTTQATSMDEPINSAAGIVEATSNKAEGKRDVACQAEEFPWWPGVSGLEALAKSYWRYERARRLELNDLHRRNTALRVSGAHITRGATRDTDRARALLAERDLLASEEAAVRRSLRLLTGAVRAVRNY